eukprot:gene2061-2339_t
MDPNNIVVHLKTTFHGIAYENENDADGILKVLQELHKLAPHAGDDKKRIYSEQGSVGDQLFVERGVNCPLQISNGYTPEERLERLHFEAGDFQAGMKFLQSGGSSCGPCTMFSDAALINRRNVGGDVKPRVSASKDFFLMEVENSRSSSGRTELG